MNYEIRYVRGHVEVYDQAARSGSPPAPGGGAREGRDQPPAAKRRPKQGAPGLLAGRPL